MTAWIVTAFLADLDLPDHLRLVLSRLAYAAALLAALHFFHFVGAFFPGSHAQLRRVATVAISIVGYGLAIVAAVTSLVAASIRREPWGFTVEPGPWYGPFVLYAILLLGYALGLYVLGFKRSRGLQRAQLEYLGLGLAVTIAVNVVAHVVLKWLLGTDQYYRLGNYSVFLFLACTAYAIVAYRLFDIRIIVKKTVLYAGLLVFVIGAYALAAFALAAAFGGQAGLVATTVLLNLVAGLVVTAGFEPLKRRLVAGLDQYLFTSTYRPEDLIRRVSQQLSAAEDLDGALEAMMHTLVEALRLRWAATVLLRRDGDRVAVTQVSRVGSDAPAKIRRGLGDSLVRSFIAARPEAPGSGWPRAVVKEELDRRLAEAPDAPQPLRDLRRRLQELGAAVALPIQSHDALVGILLLSPRVSDDIFTATDIDVLEITAHEAAAAIDGPRRYDQTKVRLATSQRSRAG